MASIIDSNSTPESLLTQTTFRPRARLVSLLGEQLIRDSAVGLVELVKNAYDADATETQIVLEDLATPETTRIYIRDNGHGMTMDQLVSCWLSPATGNKEVKKREKQRTVRGRQLTGEKGVGRFAVQRLGHKLRLVTRTCGGKELELNVDWRDFERQGAYLDEVSVSVLERDVPVEFRGDAHGTLLDIMGARTPWDGHVLRKVQRMLRRLQSPTNQGNDFIVSLHCKEYPQYEDIDPSTILTKAHYKFSGTVNKNGLLQWKYECCHGPRSRIAEGKDDLLSASDVALNDVDELCGPFEIQLYVWDRSREMMQLASMTETELDAHCGISIYRDGFRVLPYGEQGDDWLGLDARRINVPSKRVGNRNIVGLVLLSHDDNPMLRDKTSREGLIENHAYEVLRSLMRGAITLFEIERLQDRLAQNTSVVQTSSAVNFELFTQPVAHKAAPTENTHTQEQDHVVRHHATRAKVFHMAQQKQQQHEELFYLAGVGLRMDRFRYQLANQFRVAQDALQSLKRTMDGPSVHLEVLITTLGAMRNAMKELAPEVVTRAEQSSRLELDSLLREAFAHQLDVVNGAVDVYLDDNESPVVLQSKKGCLVQLLDILLDNATYWSKRGKGKKTPSIRVLVESTRVIIGDSGPGVRAEDRERIFGAYFTRRQEATGLGLYIARELAQAAGVKVFILNNTEARQLGISGAAFCVSFGEVLA